jgi:hypothetical protein
VSPRRTRSPTVGPKSSTYACLLSRFGTPTPP